MGLAKHCVTPLRGNYFDVGQMAFYYRGRSITEGSVINEKRLFLDGGIRKVIERRNLVGRYSQILQHSKRGFADFHGRCRDTYEHIEGQEVASTEWDV